MNFQVDEKEIYTGKVVYFKQKEGFGFIRPENEDIISDIYVHYTEIEKGKEGYKNLITGDVVTFKLVENGVTPEGKIKYKALDLNIVRSLGA